MDFRSIIREGKPYARSENVVRYEKVVERMSNTEARIAYRVCCWIPKIVYGDADQSMVL